jgi:ureidoacrylate peracid hydrolase
MTKHQNNQPQRKLGPNKANSWMVENEHVILARPQPEQSIINITGLPKPVSLDVNRSALIIVDMQNEFCHPDGWLAGIGVDISPAIAAIDPIKALLPLFRGLSIPVIWVNWGNRKDLSNISPSVFHVYDPDAIATGLGAPLGANTSPVLEKGAWSSQVVEQLDISGHDITVDKHRMSGFWDTCLDSVLKNLRVDTLFFAGINADQCVLHTLADANFLGYDTIMVEGATTTTSPDFCMQATLYNVRQIFGFTVEHQALIESLQTLYDQEGS